MAPANDWGQFAERYEARPWERASGPKPHHNIPDDVGSVPDTAQNEKGPSQSATAAPLHPARVRPGLSSHSGEHSLCNELYSCVDNLGLAILRQRFACSRQAE
jgi:hypothetical protein